MAGLSGFPNVAGISASSVVTGLLGEAESALWNILSLQPQWGIYKDGEIAIEIDSVLDASARSTAAVSDYRVMPGAFLSYNKVAMPRDFSFTLAVSGDQKEAFLKWVETNQENPTVFDAVFPEKTYQNVTLVECGSIREVRQGTVSRIIADCRFREIRETPVVYYKDGEQKADTSNAEDPQDLPTSGNSYVDTVVYNAKNTAESVMNKVNDVVGKYEKLKSGLSGVLND